MTVVPDIQTRPPDDEQAPDDGAVMDAYSRVVTTVARRLTPAVASLRVMVSVPGGRRPAGAGSAVVVTPDGFLLTSAHVVGGSSGGVAGFSDGRELEFEVVGADPLSDMAVIRVAAGPQGVTAATLGDADTLEVGQLVVAVGTRWVSPARSARVW